MKNFFTASFILFLSVSILYGQDRNFKLDENYPINKTGIIDLRSSDANVYITGSDRQNVHVKIERTVTIKGWVWGGEEDFKVTVREEAGNLVIREQPNSSRIGMIGTYHEYYKIEIEAPSGVSLKIIGDDGDYFIKNINGSVSLDMDDGDAQLVNCTGADFRFRLDDGDLRMDKGRGRLEIYADDADIEIQNGQFSFIDTNVDDGEIIIETSLADNGEYSFDSEDGSLNLTITSGGGEFNIRHDDTRIRTEGNFDILEDGESRTKIAMASGKARVNIHADDGSIRLATTR